MIQRPRDRLIRNRTPLATKHDMSRQAVTKHLALLEAVNLVVTIKQGREMLHYLNPVPINEIQIASWLNLRQFSIFGCDITVKVLAEIFSCKAKVRILRLSGKERSPQRKSRPCSHPLRFSPRSADKANIVVGQHRFQG